MAHSEEELKKLFSEFLASKGQGLNLDMINIDIKISKKENTDSESKAEKNLETSKKETKSPIKQEEKKPSAAIWNFQSDNLEPVPIAAQKASSPILIEENGKLSNSALSKSAEFGEEFESILSQQYIEENEQNNKIRPEFANYKRKKEIFLENER